MIEMRRVSPPLTTPILLAAAILGLACFAAPCAADWPQWRGPGLDGSARGIAPDDEAAAMRLEVAWRRPLGSGYSSVSIVDGRAVTLASFDGGDHVVAVDSASGAELWRFRVADTYLGRAGSDDGPSSTPTLSDTAVFALTASGHLVALDLATGALRWRRHLDDDFGAEPHTYGYSTAPALFEDTLFVLGGPPEGSTLLALDAATGELRWSAGSGVAEHHNPAVARFGGIDQVVVPTARAVTAYATDDGRELWHQAFEEGSHSGDVTQLDETRLLVTRWEGNTLLRLHAEKGTLRPEALWTSRDLERTYAVPVARGGHLYGYDSRFLTCVSLATGERVWRSRPPGGAGLIRIDGLLATLSPEGELVLVEAAGDGYHEHSRVELFAPRRVMTPPSVAEGTVFVRNLEELVALRPTASVAKATPATDVEDPLIAPLRRQVAQTADPAAVVDAFLAALPGPTATLDDRVYFFHRGEYEDLVITGDMTGGFAELPMRRVPATDLFYRAFAAPEPPERWEYAFKSFDETILDPRNPRSVPTPAGERSVALFGEASGSTPDACVACPTGRLETLRLGADAGDDPEGGYGVTVYLPPTYDAETDRTYPLLIWVLGSQALEFGEIPRALDAWIGTGGRPVIAAFLELSPGMIWEPRRADFATAMSTEVLPELTARFRISPDSRDRALVTQQWAAENGLPWLLSEPAIGKLAVQSPMLNEHYVERALAPRVNIDRQLSVYIDWGRYDGVNDNWGLDVAAQAKDMARVLEAAGHTVRATQTSGGSNWTRWRRATPALLETLFPSNPPPSD